MSSTAKRHAGFTIVELQIVIVVIAILATISIVAYNGIQQRARDSQRKSDLAASPFSLTGFNLAPLHTLTSLALLWEEVLLFET